MDYLAEIKKKEPDLQPLKDRQDADYNLFRLEAFVMKNSKGEVMPEMHNVGLPAPQSFAKRVISVLHKADRQTVVEGEDLDDKQKSKFEGFIDMGLAAADDLLLPKLMLGVKPSLNSYAALGGWIGGRVWLHTVDGELKFDIMPWNVRDVIWDVDSDGLIWAANKKKRSKGAVEREYGKEAVTSRGKEVDVEVVDVWDKQNNFVFVGSNKNPVNVIPHNLGYVPVMIQPVSMVPMMSMGLGAESPWRYFGESIFSGSRDLYKELNKLATLFQTMSIEAYHPAMQKPTLDLNEDIVVPKQGEVVPVRPDELFREMPKREFFAVQQQSWNILNAELQRATLPYIEYGEIAFELSAVAIAKLGEGRELIFAPIIIALKNGYKQIAQMMIDQFKKLDIKADIGRAGFKVPYSAKDLSKDCDIRFDFHSITPEDNIAYYSIAQAAKGLDILPDDVILEEVLKRSNPASDKERMAEQRLLQEVPTLYLYKQAHRLIDEKQYVEARIIADQIGMTFEEIAGPQTKAKAKRIKGMPRATTALPAGEVELMQTEMGRKGMRPQEARGA